MPYVRITLCRPRSAAELGVISECLHRAMVETFDVPLPDRFHFFQQLKPEESYVDPGYLSSGRTADFMHFEIVAGRARSAEMKGALYNKLAGSLRHSLGIPPGDVMVVLVTTAPEDWSFGDGLTAAESIARQTRPPVSA